MEDEYLRVVRLRRGRISPAEFRLREDEVGLSVFARRGSPGPTDVLQAVRAAGKQGELAVAVLNAATFRGLGLRVVRIPGGTPDPAVNALHAEARLSIWRVVVLRLRRSRVANDFNQRISPRLAEAAKLLS